MCCKKNVLLLPFGYLLQPFMSNHHAQDGGGLHLPRKNALSSYVLLIFSSIPNPWQRDLIKSLGLGYRNLAENIDPGTHSQPCPVGQELNDNVGDSPERYLAVTL